MADRERKEILIEMKADLKDLLTNLKKMPNVTAKEARQMVNALEKEFKAANKAAKAAAKQQSKAMKQVEVSAKRAEGSIRGLRRQSRELGGSFNAMGDVLTEVNPEMAQFAMGAELAGDGFRAFSRMLATGNPILIGIVTAIVAATAAYTAFTAKARENKESQERLEAVLSDTNARIRQQQEAAEQATTAMFNHASAANEAALEYQILNGSLGENELAQLKLEKKAADISDQIVENGKKAEEANRKELQANKDALRGLQTRARFLEREGTAFEKQSTAQGVSLKMSAEYASIQKEIEVTQKAVTIAEEQLRTTREQNEIVAQEAGKRFLEFATKTQQIRDKEKEDEKAKRDRLKKEREQQREKNNELREQEKLTNAIIEADEKIAAARNKAQSENLTLQQQNASLKSALFADEISQKEALEEKANIELEQLDAKIQALKEEKFASTDLVEIAQQIGDQKQLEIELDENILLLEEQKRLLREKNAKELFELERKLRDMQLASAHSAISMIGKIAVSTGKAIGNLSQDQKKAALIQFRISQGVNLAEIAMDTAKNINAVFPDPVLTTLAAALGAAQAASVATQSPPEFHMGGMINKGADTQVITALKGEAILDRSTVREIGGERGLRRLKEAGKTQQEVIVRTPFKHFDNYSKVSIKRGGALSRLQRTRSIGAY